MVTLHSAGEPRFAIGMSHPKVSEGLHQKSRQTKTGRFFESGATLRSLFAARFRQALQLGLCE